MDNTINNLSFKANIRTFTKIKNKSLFSEAKKIFRDMTSNNPKDILYITDGQYGGQIFDISNKGYIYTETINEQMKSMSSKQLAKKFVNIYNALKLHAQTNILFDGLKSDIRRAQSLLKLNTNISENWASEGKNHIAKRYEMLALNNKSVIENLRTKLKSCIDKFNNKIEKLSVNCEEIKDLSL